MPVTILTERDIAAVAPGLAEIANIVERTYRMEAEVPTKIGVHPDFPGSFCHAMPAWVPGERALGMKWVTYYPGNLARGIADSTGIVILNEPDHGMPVAIMEGMWITYARTTACAAVFARHLAPRPVRRLGLIGCGGLGTWALRMFAALFPTLETVTISSRRAETRDAFCRDHRASTRAQLVPVARVEEAVRGMDVVVSSIPKTDTPAACAAWCDAGTLVVPLDVAGCWDAATFSGADHLVTDGLEAFTRAAERARPELTGTPLAHASIFDVLNGRVDWRVSSIDRIVAVPTGVANLDMTLGWEIFKRARERGLGTTLALT